MSHKGNCWDNAVAESFFKSLKTKLIYGNKLITKEKIERERIVNIINGTAERAFDNALINGIAAEKIALSKSKKDGSKREHAAALANLPEIASQIWQKLVIKKI